jgi:hypothetical protein
MLSIASSSSSSSSSSHLSKHFLSSKDWIGSYADTHVEIDLQSVFDGKSKSLSPMELMMIAPSLPTKSGTTDWMAEFYENIRGYPSNSIKPELQKSCSTFTSTSKNPIRPLFSPSSSCCIDVYVENTTSCCPSQNMKSKDATLNSTTRPSIDATFKLLNDLKFDLTNATTPDVIRSFLMSTDTNFSMGPPNSPIAERCCSTGEKTLIPSDTTSCCTPAPVPYMVKDFSKVQSSCTTSCCTPPIKTPSATITTATTIATTPNQTTVSTMESSSSTTTTTTTTTTKTKTKRQNNGKRCCSPRIYVSEIRPTDVLLGRGGRSNHHPGNIAYRKQVGDLREWYRTSKDKRVKTDLSQLLVDWVQKENSGRFLQLETTNSTLSSSPQDVAAAITNTTTTTTNNNNGDQWYIVSNVVARRKAAQALREHMTLEERKARREQQRIHAGLSKPMTLSC